jgi:acetoin:2,6-dichlorophenolindophenol oxidoreductase subunit beta
MGRTIPMLQAINEAMHIAMAADPRVILLGEDVAGGGGRKEQGIEEAWGGVMGATKGLLKRFGPDRVLDTPISEMGFVSTAVGAAATGMRPIVELMFMDFLGVALDPMLNQAAKLRYMFGGKAKVPLTMRTLVGAGLRAAAQHSQTLYNITTAIPGLKTVCPSNGYDAKGLLLSAIRDDDPVVFCEPKSLLFSMSEVPEEDYMVPIGKANVVRDGTDVTLVGVGRTVQTALEAAETLALDGTSALVLDLRSLQPLDEDGILEALARTGRLVVIDEAPPRCGIATDVAALCVDRGFDYLRAPIKRVTAPHSPVPFSPALEDAFLPTADRIVAAVAEMG